MTLMKKYLAVCFLLISTGTLLAQSTTPPELQLDIIQDMTNVTLVQDSSITILMQEKRDGIVRGVKEMPGFRVQIYSDNTPGKAKTEALQLEERFSKALNQSVYVISAPPFFKVRIGDFLTIEQANEYKKEFLDSFPDMVGDTYVVRDEHIQVKK